MKALRALFVTAAAVAAAFLAGRGFLHFWTRREAEAAYQAALVPIRVQRAQQWADFLNALLYVALAAAIVIVGGVLVGIAMAVLRQRNLARAVPIGRDGLPAPMQYRLPDGTIVIFSPAMLPGPAAMIGPNGLQVLGDPSAVQLHQQNARVQAAAALQLPEVGRMPNAATWAAMAGRYDPKPLPAPTPMLPAPAEAPAEPVRLLTAHSALRESAPDRWIVGQNHETGALAVFNPTLHAHAGIVGATGTGKTSGVGFALVLAALNAGFGVTIFDPDGGADWQQFAGAAEWHPTDALEFPAQIAAVHAEYLRRLQARDVAHQPRIVVIEEYGDLIRQIRARNRNTAQQVDGQIDELLMRARKTRIGLVLIDQYPQHWTQPVISGVKRIFAFRMGANQGAKIGEWDAQNLADVGEFLIPNEGRGRFASFDTRGRLPSLLRSVPPSAAPRLIEGTARRLSVSDSTGSANDSPNDSSDRSLARGGDSNDRADSSDSGVGYGAAKLSPSLPIASDSLRAAPVREYIIGGLNLLSGAGYEVTPALLRRWAQHNGRPVSTGYSYDVFQAWKSERGIA